jgi:hypothetical protein
VTPEHPCSSASPRALKEAVAGKEALREKAAMELSARQRAADEAEERALAQGRRMLSVGPATTHSRSIQRVERIRHITSLYINTVSRLEFAVPKNNFEATT